MWLLPLDLCQTKLQKSPQNPKTHSLFSQDVVQSPNTHEKVSVYLWALHFSYGRYFIGRRNIQESASTGSVFIASTSCFCILLVWIAVKIVDFFRWSLQVEFYLGDSNLPSDKFLKKCVAESEDGSILILSILSFTGLHILVYKCYICVFAVTIFVFLGNVFRENT